MRSMYAKRWMNRQMDGWFDRYTDGWTDRYTYTDRQIGRWAGR